MTTQPEALRLADALDELDRQFSRNGLCGDAAHELRRLAAVEAQRDELLEALKKLDVFFETYRPDGHPVSDPHELARAAITKAEQEK